MRNLVRLTIVLVIVIQFIACNNSQNIKYTDQQDTTKVQSIVDTILFENDTISIAKIDANIFKELSKKYYKKEDTLVYFSDIEEAKEILLGRVHFAGYNEDTNKLDSTIVGDMIYQITFANGRKINVNHEEYLGELGFFRYYPALDILLCEGGHTSDYSFDLKNGLMGPDIVGNPAYILKSPKGIYQLNGWFPGQECSEYFIQKITQQDNKVFARLPLSLSIEGFDLCTIQDCFWKDDHNLYFRNFYYGDTSDNRLGYFKLTIK